MWTMSTMAACDVTSCLTELTGAATTATIRTNTTVSAVSLVHTHMSIMETQAFSLCIGLLHWVQPVLKLLFGSISVSVTFTCCVCVLASLSVCGSLYGLLTGLPESEMPYHFYTDQRFALVLLCVFLILPLSIPKEISIQKYIRSGDDTRERACTHISLFIYTHTWFEKNNTAELFEVFLCI